MALDKIHNAVKNALLKDGWTITDDPYHIKFEELDLYADLAAEKLLAAERGSEKIAIEIKSFLQPSKVRELELALGQHELYKDFLSVLAPEREVYIAISQVAYETFFQKRAVTFIVNRRQLRLIVVNLAKEEIETWINRRTIVS